MVKTPILSLIDELFRYTVRSARFGEGAVEFNFRRCWITLASLGRNPVRPSQTMRFYRKIEAFRYRSFSTE
jgi:hypothetical protein